MTQQIVLVTGATGGIGRETALLLARLGYRVFATGRKAELLERLGREAADLALETLALDVNDADSIAAAGAEVERRTDGRGLDVLVNNAGFGLIAPLETIAEADLRGQLETNVVGLVRVTQQFVPAMRRRGSGRIVNVSSVVGRMVLPFQGVYCATKHAVEALSDALRMELGPFGVRVTLVEPGPIKTRFAETSTGSAARYRGPESPYAPAVALYERTVRAWDASSPGPAIVARKIAKVLRRKRPRARYVVPGRFGAAIWAVRLTPTRWVDAIFRRNVGLTPQVLAGPVEPPPTG
ncbi:MAG: SDR family oxidoreductase [Deltaproteobacteria bacterium]|nr:SDR family oxidoreductase [Deltaproteobacteria bacterium]